jgi:metal-responsive CopG/Arc/MetJ family transcriptional regulator
MQQSTTKEKIMSQMVTYTMRIPAELIEQLDDVQIKHHPRKSRSALVREAIKALIESHQEQSK